MSFIRQIPALVILSLLPSLLSAQADTLVSPVYPGGPGAFIRHIELSTLVSHSLDIDRDIEYRADMTFTIDTSGLMHHLQIRGLPPELGDAIRRSVVSMPEWEPAQREGVAVTAYMQVRFHFLVNGNRVSVTWVDEFRAVTHREGSDALKTTLVGMAVIIMLALLLL